jgi:hypothetical protein
MQRQNGQDHNGGRWPKHVDGRSPGAAANTLSSTRAAGRSELPADFQLMTTMNPRTNQVNRVEPHVCKLNDGQARVVPSGGGDLRRAE